MRGICKAFIIYLTFVKRLDIILYRREMRHDLIGYSPMKYKYLLTFTFSILTILGYSQKEDTVFINRVVHPKLRFNKMMENVMKDMGHEKDYPLLKAGDYMDGDPRFSIAICPITMKDESKVAEVSYSLFIAPYNADSIFVGPGIHQTYLKVETSITIEAEGIEYTATVSKNGKFVLLSKITGKHINPDVKLYNNQLPDLNFSLVDGGKSLFSSYEHKNKYIYVEFWETSCGGCLSTFKDLTEVYKLYNDKIFIISMDDYVDAVDMERVKKVIQEYNMEWIQGISDESISREFLQNGFPFGVLFDSEGNIINRELLPAKLRSVLENEMRKNGK